MIVEVVALAGSVAKISNAISSSIKAGRDLNSLMPAFGKLAQLEADINLAETGRHKGPLGRLSQPEQEGFAIAQAKMEMKKARADLKEACLVYGPKGMWEMVQRETAAARVRRKEFLDLQAQKRDKLFWLISLSGGIIIFVVGVGAMIYGVDKLVNG